MTDAGYRVVFFNPGSNLNQASLLRLINPGSEPAAVTITGIDDAGASPGGAVSLSLGPQVARTLSRPGTRDRRGPRRCARRRGRRSGA